MVDAGVAAVLALTVLHSEQVQLGGILPALVKPAGSGDVFAIEGVGLWPKATDPGVLHRDHRGRIPRGILRTVTPALPDACFTALRRFGTMPFGDLARPAHALASDGFEAHDDLVAATATYERHYRTYPENTSIWLPNGRPLQLGERFRQPKLGATLQRLIDADERGGAQAARALFYEGSLAQEMLAHVRVEGGWLSADDMAGHTTPIVSAVSGKAFGATIYTPDTWCQGPTLIQCLQIAEALGIQDQAPEDWWHLILETIKLGFADRDTYFGDPCFVDVPLERLLSETHAKELANTVGPTARSRGDDIRTGAPPLDTSVVAIVDFDGGVFVATPSDMSHDAPAVPGLGFVMSTRGGQSQVPSEHPACLAPGKRPRASASPFLLIDDDGRTVAGGGPGADLAIQASVAILTQHLGQNIPLDQALSAPRAYTLEPPGSSAPHLTFPGKVRAEPDLLDDICDGLSKRGHLVSKSDSGRAVTPSICAIELDAQNGVVRAHGDPRRLSGQKTGPKP